MNVPPKSRMIGLCILFLTCRCIINNNQLRNICTHSQVKAGLSIQLSGVPYWTTDIGGYAHGNISDPVMQDLIVRWFQFGAFCPIFRVHGCRNSNFGMQN